MVRQTTWNCSSARLAPLTTVNNSNFLIARVVHWRNFIGISIVKMRNIRRENRLNSVLQKINLSSTKICYLFPSNPLHPLQRDQFKSSLTKRPPHTLYLTQTEIIKYHIKRTISQKYIITQSLNIAAISFFHPLCVR